MRVRNIMKYMKSAPLDNDLLKEALFDVLLSLMRTKQDIACLGFLSSHQNLSQANEFYCALKTKFLKLLGQDFLCRLDV